MLVKAVAAWILLMAGVAILAIITGTALTLVAIFMQSGRVALWGIEFFAWGIVMTGTTTAASYILDEA